MTPAATPSPSPLARAMFTIGAVWSLCLLALEPAGGQILLDQPPEEAQGIGVEEHLGAKIPLDATFTNAEGETVALSSYFDGTKPVVLALVYYDCPIICPQTLSRLTNAIRELDYVVGEDFNVVVVSFNPAETVTHAIGQRDRYTSNYDKTDPATRRAGWGFHIGDETNIARLADAVGFQFKRLDNGEYSHPIATVTLTGDGTVARYLYGLDLPARELKFSLLEASQGRIAASLGDVLQFQCFRYDPQTGKYSVAAMNVMRLAGIATVIGLVVLITALFLGEKARKALRKGDHADAARYHNAARAEPAGAHAS